MRYAARLAAWAAAIAPTRAVEWLVRLNSRSRLVRHLTAPLRSRVRGQPATLRYGEAQGMVMPAATTAASYGFGRYEEQFQRAFAAAISESDVVLDIGAAVGFFSLIAARRAGPTGRVFAMEPNPYSADELRRAAELNDLSQLRVVEKAAWSESTQGWLWVPKGRPPLALVVGAEGSQPPWDGAQGIALAAVDDLVDSGAIAGPSIVKIDVQGAEVHVLKGMQTTITQYRPLIFCELHGTGDEVLQLLGEFGYDAVCSEGSGHAKEVAWGAHVVARPIQRGGRVAAARQS